MSRVILKPGKEKSLIQRHPWVFSGAIASRPAHAPGEMLPVYSFDGKLLGSGYFHPENSIAGRMVTFSGENPLDAIRSKLKAAIDLRSVSEASTVLHQNLDIGLRQSPGIEIVGEGDCIPSILPPSPTTQSRELSRNSNVKILMKHCARRLVNAEGDGLPGLIIDQYGDVIVMQIHTAGMEKLKTLPRR